MLLESSGNYHYRTRKAASRRRPGGVLYNKLKQAERQLSTVDHEQRQLLQWALKGFPESQVEAENKRINKARETL